MKHIQTKEGLKTLLKRYQETGITDNTWISVIKGCIKEGLAMAMLTHQKNLNHYGKD